MVCVKRKTSNPKRMLQPSPSALNLPQLASLARYGGNPQHKRSPGDFGLTPPAEPRPDKTLCDASGVLSRNEALLLLCEGLRKGLVSVQVRNGWPQNVWAVASSGVPIEAMLDNEVTGSYHGYPMLEGDPLREEILRAWGNHD